MIVDAHCHAWRSWPYQPQVPDPGRGSAANLLWEMDRAGVEKAAVICASIGDNPDNAADVSVAAGGSGGRLLPFVDVDCRWNPTHLHPGATRRLDEALARFRPVGVAFYLDENASANWLLTEEGGGFLGMLASRRIILSLACGPGQAAVVSEAARRHHRLAILAHHLWRVRAGDREGLAAVVAAAAQPNISVKLSGFGYGVDAGWDYPLVAMRPVVGALLAAFGPSRLLWGSDWPVSQRFMTYRQSLEILRTHGPPLAHDDLALILGGNMLRLLEPGDGEA
jgi:L-fuconolactonase